MGEGIKKTVGRDKLITLGKEVPLKRVLSKNRSRSKEPQSRINDQNEPRNEPILKAIRKWKKEGKRKGKNTDDLIRW